MTVFEYAAAIEKAFERAAKDANGYERKTTFAHDFALSEPFKNGIEQTYNQAAKEWFEPWSYEYATELVWVLNFLCWLHHGLKHNELSEKYSNLYYIARDRLFNAYRGNNEALSYIYQTLD